MFVHRHDSGVRRSLQVRHGVREGVRNRLCIGRVVGVGAEVNAQVEAVSEASGTVRTTHSLDVFVDGLDVSELGRG